MAKEYNKAVNDVLDILSSRFSGIDGFSVDHDDIIFYEVADFISVKCSVLAPVKDSEYSFIYTFDKGASVNNEIDGSKTFRLDATACVESLMNMRKIADQSSVSNQIDKSKSLGDVVSIQLLLWNLFRFVIISILMAMVILWVLNTFGMLKLPETVTKTMNTSHPGRDHL